jgi:hypothetical protein
MTVTEIWLHILPHIKYLEFYVAIGNFLNSEQAINSLEVFLIHHQ